MTTKGIDSAVALIRDAFSNRPGRAFRIALLPASLLAYTPSERKAAAALAFGDFVERYDVRAGHCMHDVTNANCFRSPCMLCPDHPDNRAKSKA